MIDRRGAAVRFGWARNGGATLRQYWCFVDQKGDATAARTKDVLTFFQRLISNALAELQRFGSVAVLGMQLVMVMMSLMTVQRRFSAWLDCLSLFLVSAC